MAKNSRAASSRAGVINRVSSNGGLGELHRRQLVQNGIARFFVSQVDSDSSHLVGSDYEVRFLGDKGKGGKTGETGEEFDVKPEAAGRSAHSPRPVVFS
jgi:hypothetical protein